MSHSSSTQYLSSIHRTDQETKCATVSAQLSGNTLVPQLISRVASVNLEAVALRSGSEILRYVAVYRAGANRQSSCPSTKSLGCGPGSTGSGLLAVPTAGGAYLPCVVSGGKTFIHIERRQAARSDRSGRLLDSVALWHADHNPVE